MAEACVVLLEQVFDEGRVLDRAIAEAFKANPKWGKRDRGFVAESVWEVVRWRRALGFVAGAEDPRSLLAAEWRRQGFTLPDWWEWSGVDVGEMENRESQLASQPRAIRESIPDWLDLLGSSELGDRWDAELSALNQRAPVCLRVNRLIASKEEVVSWLNDEGVEVEEVEGLDDALMLPLGKLLPKRLFQDGRVEIQDAGSQTVAPLLGVEPGMRVVDACAGAGGKTLQLAAAMQGSGEILALDVSARKLTELKRRAGRAGVRNVRMEEWGKNTLKTRIASADRVLVDAPCSGLGTLRRQPDLKWRLSKESVEDMRDLQSRILENCLEFLKDDGQLVYATCSLLPSENEQQIAELLQRDSRWRLDAEMNISPAATGWDAFYGCRLVKR
ncbi:RsmB/NOP family class I SAM-dependent RNA methyltransferase [Haloferula chungangensis]|uniref:RsmB/NOP family class I SAM-dependent RNA methyltransferase n=1 Tax=Haloferula chungangensis TaxID=1048331 RepID=A0ABW2LAK0_9BACT